MLKLILTNLRWFGLFLVFIAIWGPWVAFNHLSEPEVVPAMVEAGRSVPDDALLKELGRYDHFQQPMPWVDDLHLVGSAEKMLTGAVDLPGFDPSHFKLPFDAESMAMGTTNWQLFVHSLGLPRVFLDAYKVDGRVQFLDAAADYLLAYDAYEGSGWSPGGYLWKDAWSVFVRNDHAIAARVPVLTEFWRLYRKSPNYRAEVSAAVFRMAARAGKLLLEPARFTVATNHGVMQNLAACNVGLSFPALSGAGGHCKLAFKRLEEQLTFLINDEGFILEHSPGYQAFSLKVIGIALRFMTLSKQEIPEIWRQKYAAAQRVLSDLRRPDGSLPVFGDTDSEADPSGPVVTAIDESGRAKLPIERIWLPQGDTLIAPVAGYTLWWDGLDNWPGPHGISQTVTAWSHFPGMGHKHADELSVSMWANGTHWWTNVGYWPYDVFGRDMAESWGGANAPHLVGERSDSSRKSQLRYHGRNGLLAMIDLERRGPRSYIARRQVIHVGKSLWAVVDTTSGTGEDRTRTIWTTSPKIEMRGNEHDGVYALTEPVSGQSLNAYFDGAPGITRRAIKGSHAPFGGWLVVADSVEPASAVVIERPSDGAWNLALWSLSDKGSVPTLAGVPRMHNWVDADNWELVVPAATGEVKITRNLTQVTLSGLETGRSSLTLVAGNDVTVPTEKLHNALASASKKYGATFYKSGLYRMKVSAVLIVLFVANAIIIRSVERFRMSWASIVMLLLTIGWLFLSYYFIFLRANLM